jgi:hypothetical protein
LVDVVEDKPEDNKEQYSNGEFEEHIETSWWKGIPRGLDILHEM